MAERQLMRLRQGLPSDQRVKERAVAVDTTVPAEVPVSQVMRRQGKLADRAVEALQKLERDRAQLRTLCSGYGGRLPGVPGACEEATKRPTLDK